MLGDHLRVPDLIEAVRGWRYWNATHGDTYEWVDGDDALSTLLSDAPQASTGDDGVHLLLSPYRSTTWAGGVHTWDGVCHCGATVRAEQGPAWGQRLVQLARRSRLVRRLWPIASSDWLGCHCGVNAWRTREQALTQVEFGSLCDAFGEVSLSGRVSQFSTGWRAEHARIERVWATNDGAAERVEAAAMVAGIAYQGVLCHEELTLHRELLIDMAIRFAPLILVAALWLAVYGAALWAAGALAGGALVQLAARRSARSSWSRQAQYQAAGYVAWALASLALGALLVAAHVTMPVLFA